MRKFLLSLAFVVVASCASGAPSDYGPAGRDGFGFAETRIENDRYRVRYSGSGGDTRDLVEENALRRAAEIAVEEGYDWFRVVSRETLGDQRGGVNLGAGVGSGRVGRNTGVGVGVGGNLGTIGARQFFTARLEVLFGRGERPAQVDGAEIYDPTEILARLNGS
ncbi:MAG: hypothetical protein AAF850_02900 [Pseudomonadota bacterium]